MKKYKPNLYWIYGIIFLAILLIRFSININEEASTISHNEFVRLIISGDVKKIIKIKKKKIVRFYIKPDSVQKGFYIQKFKQKLSKEKANSDYLFEYKIDSWYQFNKELETIYTKYEVMYVPEVSTVEENDYFAPLANSFFSIIIIIIIIIWIRRNVGIIEKKENPYEKEYKLSLKGNDKHKALVLARLYYSWYRKDGNLTVYDEAAISNDLSTIKET